MRCKWNRVLALAVLAAVVLLASPAYSQQVYASSAGAIRVISTASGSVSTLQVNNVQGKMIGKVSASTSGDLLLPVPSLSAIYKAAFPTGNILEAVVFAGTPGAPTSGTTGFAYPAHVVGVPLSGAGNEGKETVYVADAVNCDIRAISPAGVISIVAGASATPGFADGVGTNARFSGPTALVVDPLGGTSGAGALLVADSLNYAVRKVALGATPSVSTIAGVGGVPGGDTTHFLHVRDIALQADGAGGWKIVVADEQKIRFFTYTASTSGATISDLAGSGGSSYTEGYIEPLGVVAFGATKVVAPTYCPKGMIFSSIDAAGNLSPLAGSRAEVGCALNSAVAYTMNGNAEAVLVAPPAAAPAPTPPLVVSVKDVVAQDTNDHTTQEPAGWKISTTAAGGDKVNWYLIQAWDNVAATPHTDSVKKVLAPFVLNSDGYTLKQITSLSVTLASGSVLAPNDLFVRVYTKPQGASAPFNGDCKTDAAGAEWYHASYYAPILATGTVNLNALFATQITQTVAGATPCYSVQGTRTRSTAGYTNDADTEILAVSLQSASNVALNLVVESVTITLAAGDNGIPARSFVFNFAEATTPVASDSAPVVFTPSLGSVAPIFSICGAYATTGSTIPTTCSGGSLVQETTTLPSGTSITVTYVSTQTLANAGELAIVGGGSGTQESDIGDFTFTGSAVFSINGAIVNVVNYGPAAARRSDERALLQSGPSMRFTFGNTVVSRMNVANSLDITGTNLVIELARDFVWPPGTVTQIIAFGPNFATLKGEFVSVTIVQSVVRSASSRSLLQSAQTGSVSCSTGSGGCFVTAGGAKSSSSDSNALTIALVVVSVALVLALAFGAFYYYRRSSVSNNEEEKAIRPRPRDGYYAGNQDGTFNNYGAIKNRSSSSSSSSSDSSSSSVEDGDFAPAASRYGTIPRKSTSTSTSTSTSSPSTSTRTGTMTTTTSSSSLSDGSDSSSSHITSNYN